METVMEARGVDQDHRRGGKVVYPRSHIMEVTLEPRAVQCQSLISFLHSEATWPPPMMAVHP